MDKTQMNFTVCELYFNKALIKMVFTKFQLGDKDCNQKESGVAALSED